VSLVGRAANSQPGGWLQLDRQDACEIPPALVASSLGIANLYT